MKPISISLTIITIATVAMIAVSTAQRPDGPRRPGGPGGPGGKREHLETKSKPLELVPADQEPPVENKVEIKVEGDKRIITSNNIPDHLIGKYPNPGNPNVIAEQDNKITLPVDPKANERSVPARKAVGIFLNGVLVEAGTGEFWTGGNSREWNYEALGGAIPFGIDANYAHVQPGGKYHYHGKPTALLESVELSPEKHSPIVGWAFDGFPIYALYGYSDPKDPTSEIVEFTSSYRLKSGERPGAPDGPGGKYDGAFTADYEYVEGAGTLDECNGRFTVTPEFPEGTYAYFLTNAWPVIFRDYRGTPAVVPTGGGKMGPRGSGGQDGRGPGQGGPPPGK